MTLAFIFLVIGGVLLGGAWSFRQQKQSPVAIVVLAVLGVLCIGVAFWRINQ